MKLLILVVAFFFTTISLANDVIIKQTDKYGNVLNHEKSWVVEGNKITPVDSYGNKLYHENGFVIEGNKLVVTDKYGNKVPEKQAIVKPKI